MADEGLSAGAVARRLGVAVTTLRTWHQRYGLGPSQHVPGRHRRYTADDLVRLEAMRRLTSQGVTPAEAARWAGRPASEVRLLTTTGVRPPGADASVECPAQSSGSPPAPGEPAATLVEPTTALEEPTTALEPAADRPGADPAARGPTLDARRGGGSAIPLAHAVPAARGLAHAAMRLDTTAMRDLIARSIAESGVVETWDTVLRPVLVGIGERHASTAALVEVEHLLSRTISELLGSVPRPGSDGPMPDVLLACADEEQHSLPLEALAAALAEAGLACRLLGARVPPAALRDAVARTGPRAVLIWSHLPSTAAPAQLAALLAAPRRPLLVAAAGPGWKPDTLPAGVVVPANLTEAVTVTMAVAT